MTSNNNRKIRRVKVENYRGTCMKCHKEVTFASANFQVIDEFNLASGEKVWLVLFIETICPHCEQEWLFGTVWNQEKSIEEIPFLKWENLERANEWIAVAIVFLNKRVIIDPGVSFLLAGWQYSVYQTLKGYGMSKRQLKKEFGVHETKHSIIIRKMEDD